MRDRLYVAARNSSSRGHARGRGGWQRGFCDGRGNGDAFVGGDEHLRAVSEENYVHRVGWRNAGVSGYGAGPGVAPPPDLGFSFPPPPQPSGFRLQAPPYYPISGPRGLWRPVRQDFGPRRPPVPGAPPRQPWQRPPPPPADFRKWIRSSSPPPPPETGRFTVLSYNILADYLARDHQSKLYFHIPDEILDWEWRKNRLLIEFGLWSPDIMCLQEVDRFHDLEEELTRRGYTGVWKMRTGDAVDGCAVFWRPCRFVLRHEEHIEFAKLGLRDNIAQICVFESKSQTPDSPETSLVRSDRVVVCNIHVLYNPKRGEIKLGQVRTLINQAYSVSKTWDDAPVIICGDFNCTPKSPLYNFVSKQKLNLCGLARNEVSGQYSPIFYPPRTFTQEMAMRSNYSSKCGADNASLGTKMNVTDDSITCEEKVTVTVDMLQPSKNLISGETEEVVGTLYDASLQAGGSVISTLREDLTVTKISEESSESCQNLHLSVRNEEILLTRKWVIPSEVASLSNPERNLDLDLSHRISYENKNLGSCSDCSVEKVKNLSSEDITSVDFNETQDMQLEASSCPVDDGEDGGSNPSFLEELHGKTNHQMALEEQLAMPSSYPDPYSWTPMEIAAASGDPERTTLEHNLKLISAYTQVEDYSGTKDASGEPKVTSYNRKFMGTVDYIWHSEGLQTIRVLDTIPHNVLRRTSGFPTRKWGSDHIALVCEFAFKKT